MRLIKYTHACVRLEKDDSALVLDPGAFSELDRALAGADAVLITHEHMDHVNVDAVKAAQAPGGPGLPVYASAEVAEALDGVDVSVLTPGHVEIAGFDIAVSAGPHADIWDGRPGIGNYRYLVDGAVYHPGDSLLPPDDGPVDVLLVPVSGPWMKLGEALDFVTSVRPRVAVPIHEGLLSAPGNGLVDAWMGGLDGLDYRRLAAGEGFDV